MYKEICSEDKSLRDYQKEIKRKIFTAWDEYDTILLQMPTGTGKTRLFSSIIRDLNVWRMRDGENFKILIVAHRRELLEQIKNTLNTYGTESAIIAGGYEKNFSQQVLVASIQSISQSKTRELIKELNISFIIVDEAHHSLASSYKKLWEIFPDAKKLGVTATPWRMNGSGFSNIYEQFILSPSIKQFINEGWLSPYDYYSIGNKSNLRIKIDGITKFDIEGDYSIDVIEQIMDDRMIYAQLLNSYLKYANGKKGIIYSISRKHSEHILNKFKEANISIVAIDSRTTKELRENYVKRFKAGQIKIIVNVDIFSEGFDCPDIEFIQIARPTKSLVKFLQQIGRGLRPADGIQKCIILDNVGDYFEFGLPDEERDWNQFYIGSEQVKGSRLCGKKKIVERTTIEPSFDEGDEELVLISEAQVVPQVRLDTKNKWTESDDALLRTLYIDKDCSMEVISQVFKRDKIEIESHIEELGLIKSN